MDKQNLDKLDRLSRIEYFLKNKDNEYHPFEFTCLGVKLILGAFLFFMMFDLYSNINFGINTNLVSAFLESGIIILTLLLSIVMELIYLIANKFNKKKLDKEFFSFEIKPKEVKNVKR